MGRCNICGDSTKYNYPLCWKHYYFNFQSERFWVSLILTIIWEYLINFPIITEEGLMILLLKNLFDITHIVWFLIGAVIVEIAVFIGSLMFMNYVVYGLFFSKKAIFK